MSKLIVPLTITKEQFCIVTQSGKEKSAFRRDILEMSGGNGIGDRNLLQKRIPRSARYDRVQAKTDTGASMSKVLIILLISSFRELKSVLIRSQLQFWPDSCPLKITTTVRRQKSGPFFVLAFSSGNGCPDFWLNIQCTL